MKSLLRASVMALAAAAFLSVVPASAADQNAPTGTTGLIGIDKIGAAILFLDPVTYKTISSIKTERNPHEVAISLDHKTAYVSIYGPGVYGKNPTPNNKVLIIDLASRAVTGEIDVSPYKAPHGLMLDPQGMLYVSCDAERKLLIIDPKTRKIVEAIDTEGTGHWVSLTPDGSKAYVGNKYDKPYVTVIDLKTRKIVARIPMPDGMEGLAVSPDGKRMIVANGVNPSLVMVDTATDKVLQRVPLENFPKTADGLSHLTRVRFSLDGKKVFASYTPSGVIAVMPITDLRKQKLIGVPEGPMGFAFPADGKTALVTGHDFGSIAIIDITGDGKYVRDFPAGEGVETIAFY